MNLKLLKPKKALNKAYLKIKPHRNEIENFKAHLTTLFESINENETEEFHKNLVIDFLKKSYYDSQYFINTKGKNDLVIHNGKTAKSNVGVIIEAKSPINKYEMITTENLNRKAFQELVLYYLRERITQKNIEIKHLIATNIYEWFIFDAQTFDRLFAQNKNLVKQFQDFEVGRLSETKTDFFYSEIAASFINQIHAEIQFTYFDFRSYTPLLRGAGGVSSPLLRGAGGVSPHPSAPAGASDNKLIALFKLLSPEHLLKLPFANDSNSLDKTFYSELLHIIGLVETSQSGKKLIERPKLKDRISGTLLENTIIQLDSLDVIHRMSKVSQYGENISERYFNVALELVITWINRILFLKLMEAQLIRYNRDDSYSFLNSKMIKDYDDLNSLFFQVLAKRKNERNTDIAEVFKNVPYLNSSLFEPADIERNATIYISGLRDDLEIPIYTKTVLKDESGKRKSGKLSTLRYLFEFLNAYDFSSEGSEEIQEENKTLINASVLGLIFEKINGYKDGSFFTPGFITMYMAREAIRKAAIQKFNDAASLLSREGGGVSSPLSRGGGGVFSSRLSGAGSASSPRRKIIPYNPKLKELARNLRNNSTKSEIILWKQLKGKFEGRYDFHRQKPLDNYIADFYCYELKLVIEIDGETHNWEETQQKDFKKESRLNELGLNVLRFPDSEIFEHLDSTLQVISDYINGFENNDLSKFKYEDTPLNPLSRGDFALPDHIEGSAEPKFKTLEDIYEQIGDDRMFTRQDANDIVNSIKICDPAVGSGHFLVSALNEMIALKNDLKILQDRNGSRLKEYQVEVVNDELIVTDEDGELFEYHPYTPPAPLKRGVKPPTQTRQESTFPTSTEWEEKTRSHSPRENSKISESQRVQETLFHEKQTIIENCLFGVDINPNSVKICRLRLWIELLKNAYYKTSFTEEPSPHPNETGRMPSPLLRGDGGVSSSRGDGGVLETLPNIDINIKVGNSLISRFDLDANIKNALKNSKWTIDSYRLSISAYHNAENKEEKHEMERLIEDIKSDFRTKIDQPFKEKLSRARGKVENIATEINTKKQWGEKLPQKLFKDLDKASKRLKKLEVERDELKENKIYENAFEWRFEFPQVLDDEGNFVGFDVVIANPPYIQLQKMGKESDELSKLGYETFAKTGDIYSLFYELGYKIIRKKGTLIFITSNKWMRAGYGEKTRSFFSEKTNPQILIDFAGVQIFDSATVDTNILMLSKEKNQFKTLACVVKDRELKDLSDYVRQHSNTSSFDSSSWVILSPIEQQIKRKIEKKGTPLKDWDIRINYGIKTGCNEAFIINEEKREELITQDPKSDEIIRPILRGRDIKKYGYDFANLYLLFIPWHFPLQNDQSIKGPSAEAETEFATNYPAVYNHLLNYKNKLSSRNKAETGIRYEWYALQRWGANYWEDFTKQKIVWARLMRISKNTENSFPRFSLVPDGIYATDSLCFIVGKDLNYLERLLNSKIAEFYFFNNIAVLDNGGMQMRQQYIENFPIPIPDKRLSLDDNAIYSLYDFSEDEISFIEEFLFRKYHEIAST